MIGINLETGGMRRERIAEFIVSASFASPRSGYNRASYFTVFSDQELH
jgi:hypothetical protein